MTHTLNKVSIRKGFIDGSTYTYPAPKMTIRIIFCLRGNSRLWINGKGIAAMIQSVTKLIAPLKYLCPLVPDRSHVHRAHLPDGGSV